MQRAVITSEFCQAIVQVLFFEMPKHRTMSTWRQAPWQISWACIVYDAQCVVP
jgi:hypothetical protein